MLKLTPMNNEDIVYANYLDSFAFWKIQFVILWLSRWINSINFEKPFTFTFVVRLLMHFIFWIPLFACLNSSFFNIFATKLPLVTLPRVLKRCFNKHYLVKRTRFWLFYKMYTNLSHIYFPLKNTVRKMSTCRAHLFE